MKALAVALLIGLVCVAGGEPVHAAEGSKVFKKDCRLDVRSESLGGDEAAFYASDSGSECGEYLVRSISITTRSGKYSITALGTFDRFPDAERDPDLEDLVVYGNNLADPFLYGNVNVYIPYRSRCDTYRLYADSTFRFLGSRPCTGSRYPPGVKVFEKDCAAVMAFSHSPGPTAIFTALETGSECGEYVLRGIGVVATSGEHAAAGLSDGDYHLDPDLEALRVAVPGTFAYGNLNVYIPYRSRCDKFRLYRDKTFRRVESVPCSSETG